MLTRHAEKLPEEMREDLLRHKEEASERFQAHLARLMEERGIESLEELHRRFVETEFAHVPVPGLHEGKPISFALFKQLAARRTPYIYGELLEGLTKVLGLDSRETDELILVYTLGEIRGE